MASLRCVVADGSLAGRSERRLFHSLGSRKHKAFLRYVFVCGLVRTFRAGKPGCTHRNGLKSTNAVLLRSKCSRHQLWAGPAVELRSAISESSL